MRCVKGDTTESWDQYSAQHWLVSVYLCYQFLKIIFCCTVTWHETLCLCSTRMLIQFVVIYHSSNFFVYNILFLSCWSHLAIQIIPIIITCCDLKNSLSFISRKSHLKVSSQKIVIKCHLSCSITDRMCSLRFLESSYCSD